MKPVNIILGGTSGLGASIAAQLRDEGERVLVLGSSYDVKKHGDGARVDLAGSNSVNDATLYLEGELSDQVLKSFWWVAGYGYNGDFSGQEDPEKMVTINFSGALPLVQLAWQKLLEQNNGTLAVVSSTSGVKARDNEAVYVATKYAQVGFTRSLGLEAQRLGSSASVALFMPGGMRTPFWGERRPDAYISFNDPDKVAQKMISAVRSQGDEYLELMIERGEYI